MAGQVIRFHKHGLRIPATFNALLTENNIIDIAPGGQTAPLKEHLGHLFDSLFPTSVSADRQLRLRLRTLFAFNPRESSTDSSIEVTTPIQLWPGFAIDSTTIPKLIDDVSTSTPYVGQYEFSADRRFRFRFSVVLNNF